MKRDFASSLANDIKEFLKFKRALGHPYDRGEKTLLSLDRYINEHSDVTNPLEFERLLFGWLSRIEKRKPVTVATDLGVIRQFCLYKRRKDPGAFVPDRHWAPQSTESDFAPYIFSSTEMVNMLKCTDTIRPPKIRGISIRMWILILYCTGLRPGEALRLQLRDVNLENQLFAIRNSKGKTRQVPFKDDLRQELEAYLDERSSIASTTCKAPLLVCPDGSQIQASNASRILRCLLRRIGLKPQRGRIGPRPYDLRHTFAVHRLTAWYHDNIDINAKLPLLSAYMGHENILGTEVYLTATPELLETAATRFQELVQNGENRR